MSYDISSYINKWKHLLQDLISLKILFYLREYNPNVSVNNLTKDLNIDEAIIHEKLRHLLELEIIERQENGNYKLSDTGRIVTDGFYHNLNETPKN